MYCFTLNGNNAARCAEEQGSGIKCVKVLLSMQDQPVDSFSVPGLIFDFLPGTRRGRHRGTESHAVATLSVILADHNLLKI